MSKLQDCSAKCSQISVLPMQAEARIIHDGIAREEAALQRLEGQYGSMQYAFFSAFLGPQIMCALFISLLVAPWLLPESATGR